jgi:plastocyanin
MLKSKSLFTCATLGAVVMLGAAHAADVPVATDWSRAQTIDIAMSDFSFAPAKLQLHARQPYRLHLTNSASHGHNFDAPVLFADAAVAPDDQSKVVDGSIEVAGGQSIDVKFVPNTAGTYKFHCSHFLHSAFGMTGQAVVE